MENILKIEGYELLSQKVYRVLKTEIVKGSLKPGTKLLESQIANQMDISRTPIREAFRKLAAEGFVKITPNYGIVVSETSLEDLREVLQIRMVLEGLAARFAAKKIKSEEIGKLEKIIEQMSLSISRNDVLSYSKLNGKFHDLILNICGNKRLKQICRNLSDRAHRFRIRSLRVSGRLKYSLEEHRSILEALKRGNSLQADRLSRLHIVKILDNILLNEVIK